MSRPTNNQRALNIVWQHFVVKRSKQSILDDHWVYRGPYGRKCAIGLLIPDEDYDADMEGFVVDEILEEWSDLQLVTKDVMLLQALQQAHDFVAPYSGPGAGSARRARIEQAFSEKVRARLEQVAQRFHLTTS